jgi:hypothetical protein
MKPDAFELPALTKRQLHKILGEPADVADEAIAELLQDARLYLKLRDGRSEKQKRGRRGRPSRSHYSQLVKESRDFELAAFIHADHGDIEKDDALAVHRVRTFFENRQKRHDSTLADLTAIRKHLKKARRSQPRHRPNQNAIHLASDVAGTLCKCGYERPVTTPDGRYCKVLRTLFAALHERASVVGVARDGWKLFQQTVAYEDWQADQIELGSEGGRRALLTRRQREQRHQAAENSARKRRL